MELQGRLLIKVFGFLSSSCKIPARCPTNNYYPPPPCNGEYEQKQIEPVIEEEEFAGQLEDILAAYDDNILHETYDDLIEASKESNKVPSNHETLTTQPTPRTQSFQEMLLGACGGKLFMPNPGFVSTGHMPNGTPCVSTPPFKHGDAHVTPTMAADGPSTEKTMEGLAEEGAEVDSGEEGDEESEELISHQSS
ncbi:hypothetical protein AG4045_018920 [Apium graveolens]|uniref:Uncharacterized protein n=1 Tax=Apium graveolens TaxID=4045 RepID=A0A6L5BA02_APIGR|nr:hypothetical protein AG4045_018920 [Apium graveolens]